MVKVKDEVSLRINNPMLISYIRRVQRTGIYGARETETVVKLVEQQIEHLLLSGKLLGLEQHGKETKEIERFAETDSNKKTKTN